MNTFDLDPKGYLPLIQSPRNRLFERLGLHGEERAQNNVVCCA